MAAKFYGSLKLFVNDDEYKATGLAISNFLASAGLTKVYSNVNWATAQRPLNATVNQNYYGFVLPHKEVWAFSDALQATKPVFIEIYYGINSGGTNQDQATDRGSMMFLFNAGTGVDLTTGVLKNASDMPTALTVQGQYAARTGAAYLWDQGKNVFSADNNRLFMGFEVAQGSGTGGGFFSIERTKAEVGDGTDSDYGLLVSRFCNLNYNGLVNSNIGATYNYPNGISVYTQYMMQVLHYTKPNAKPIRDFPALVSYPYATSNNIVPQTSLFYDSLSAFAIFHLEGLVPLNSGMNFMGVFNADFQDSEIPYVIKVYGQDHKFLKIPFFPPATTYMSYENSYVVNADGTIGQPIQTTKQQTKIIVRWDD